MFNQFFTFFFSKLYLDKTVLQPLSKPIQNIEKKNEINSYLYSNHNCCSLLEGKKNEIVDFRFFLILKETKQKK